MKTKNELLSTTATSTKAGECTFVAFLNSTEGREIATQFPELCARIQRVNPTIESQTDLVGTVAHPFFGRPKERHRRASRQGSDGGDLGRVLGVAGGIGGQMQHVQAIKSIEQVISDLYYKAWEQVLSRIWRDLSGLILNHEAEICEVHREWNGVDHHPSAHEKARVIVYLLEAHLDGNRDEWHKGIVALLEAIAKEWEGS
jgi:hypothetical protein